MLKVLFSLVFDEMSFVQTNFSDSNTISRTFSISEGRGINEIYLLYDNNSSSTASLSVLSNDTSPNVCHYEPISFLVEKFYLMTVFGSVVATFGIFNNVILVYILSRPALAASHVFYLLFLAIFDLFVAVSFILLFSVQPLFDYAHSVWLYNCWFMYLKPIFTVSHVTMTISTYLIVAASAERYLATRLKKSCLPKDRILITMFVVCFAIVSKGVVYWELEVIHRPNCTGFEEWHLEPSSLALEPIYRTAYMVWFRQIVHVFLPFFLLVCLNGAIINRLKRSLHTRSALMELALGAEAARQRKQNIRAATRMLVVLVSTYLLANLFNVVISLIEHLNYSYLLTHPKFYTLATDVITLLTVVTGSIRLPIYYVCNQQIRKEFHKLLLQKCLHRIRWRYKLIFAGKNLNLTSL